MELKVTKEEKGPNIAVRSPIAEKRRRESESGVLKDRLQLANLEA
jgi:hypothetical protein